MNKPIITSLVVTLRDGECNQTTFTFADNANGANGTLAFSQLKAMKSIEAVDTNNEKVIIPYHAVISAEATYGTEEFTAPQDAFCETGEASDTVTLEFYDARNNELIDVGYLCFGEMSQDPGTGDLVCNKPVASNPITLDRNAECVFPATGWLTEDPHWTVDSFDDPTATLHSPLEPLDLTQFEAGSTHKLYMLLGSE